MELFLHFRILYVELISNFSNILKKKKKKLVNSLLYIFTRLEIRKKNFFLKPVCILKTILKIFYAFS